MFDDFFQEVQELGWRAGSFKPHKLIALLTAIIALEDDLFSHNRVYFNDSFKQNFSSLFKQYARTDVDRDRPYNPFFYLKTSSFWSLVPRSGKEKELNSTLTIGGPSKLNELVEHALLSDEALIILQDGNSREKLISLIKTSLIENTTQVEEQLFFPNVGIVNDVESGFNPFVGYLNSLQRSAGGNENALAESQVCNPLFSAIHIKHPLTDSIYNELIDPAGRHVLLTGHAGDGKSTIAMDVYKLFLGKEVDQSLDAPPRARIDLENVSIIKDLSERDKSHDFNLLKELSKTERRFLLVSNTGTLLDLVKQSAPYFDKPVVELENHVLKAISHETGEAILSVGNIEFKVFNLALIDNIPLARRVFEKMLAPAQWKVCQSLACRESCPVFFNVNLLQAYQERATERIFLAYRRMYEYGTRLTMRQFTEHLAYLITSGLGRQEINKNRLQNSSVAIIKHLFFNRFFGDNGYEFDDLAFEMKAVQEINKQKFGERPYPEWEHKLWLRNCGDPVELGVDVLNEKFEALRRYGSKELQSDEIAADLAREQVRRIFYFLANFTADEQGYLKQFLNSPTLLDWVRWQEDGVRLEFQEKQTLERKIYHVLQEHFTGVRLPEGSTQSDHRRLYVTLSRRRNEVRQSAQVVLAEIDWSDSIDVRLDPTFNASAEQRQDLILIGKERTRIEGLRLPLKVPFLDYVMMRHVGELGEVLEAAYWERLDCFKAQVQARASIHDDNPIMLVRLQTDHTFRRQRFAVNGDHLEVSNDF